MQSKYKQHLLLSDRDFRRLTGVHKATFEQMLFVLTAQLYQMKKVSGRPSRLSVADQLLMMLEYNREYRTYFHIGQSYLVSEATAFRLISRAENYLIKSGKFSLPGKKALLESQTNYEILIVDATETKVERPKKNKSGIIPLKRNNII